MKKPFLIASLTVAFMAVFSFPVTVKAWDSFTDVWQESTSTIPGYITAGYTSGFIKDDLISFTAYPISSGYPDIAMTTDFYLSDSVVSACAAEGKVPCIRFLSASGTIMNNAESGACVESSWENTAAFYHIEWYMPSPEAYAFDSLALDIECGVDEDDGYLGSVTSLAHTYAFMDIPESGSFKPPPPTFPTLDEVIASSTSAFSSEAMSEWCAGIYSTSSWLDATASSIGVAFCKLGVMLIIPSATTTNSLIAQRDALMTQFPVSLIPSLISVVSSTTAETTTSSTELAFDFSIASSSFANATSIHTQVFGQAIYEKSIATSTRMIFRWSMSLALWWGLLWSSFALGMVLFREKHE